jgi:hypothetical protein
LATLGKLLNFDVNPTYRRTPVQLPTELRGQRSVSVAVWQIDMLDARVRLRNQIFNLDGVF